MKSLRSCLVLCLSLVSLSAFSNQQNDDKKVYPGYVVTMSGDTIRGNIEMLSPSLNEIKVKIIDDEGRAKIYKSKEVKSYGFEFTRKEGLTRSLKKEWIQYVHKRVERSPVPFGPRDILMEQQVAGTINLYSFYMEVRTRGRSFEHFFYVEKDGQMIKVDNDNFKETLQELTSDYPELAVKIGKKGYGYRYLANIIMEYNTRVEVKNPVIIGLQLEDFELEEDFYYFED